MHAQFAETTPTRHSPPLDQICTPAPRSPVLIKTGINQTSQQNLPFLQHGYVDYKLTCPVLYCKRSNKEQNASITVRADEKNIDDGAFL